MMTWVVRLGGARGEGRYVSRWAMLGAFGFVRDGRTTAAQRYAKRFRLRALAELHADAFGGRVVRLRERSGR